MTARSTSRSRASCCCPCGLAPVVTVAAGTTWGDATPCYASYHMMLVLLYGLANNNNPTLKPRLVFSTLKPRLVEHARTQTDGRIFFFQAEDGIRDCLLSRGLGDVYKRQVVTVAAGTTWGDATPCYASHHMMLVLLYGLAHNTYPTLKPRQFFHTKTKISRTSGHTDGQFFFSCM